VQKYVAGLRKVLEPGRSRQSAFEVLTWSEAGYTLHAPALAVDSQVFTEQVHLAAGHRARGHHPEAAATLRAALGLWRAEPLAGLSGDVFAGERQRLEDVRAAALEALAESDLELGQVNLMLPRVLPEDPALQPDPPPAPAVKLDRPGGAAPVSRPTGRWQSPAGGQGSPPEFGADQPGAFGPSAGPWVGYTHTPPSPAPGRRRAPLWLRLLLVAVPVLTFGAATCAAIALFAALRRSWWLALAAAGYLAVFAVGASVLGDEGSMTPTDDALFALNLVITIFGGMVHLAVLMFAAPPNRPSRLTLDTVAKRSLARQLVIEFPAAAQLLAVGRPDMPRALDDGGLIDVNAVSFAVLSGLPGVGPQQAQHLITDRELNGPYDEPGDLVSREVLPATVVARLSDVLVAVPRMHRLGGG